MQHRLTLCERSNGSESKEKRIQSNGIRCVIRINSSVWAIDKQPKNMDCCYPRASDELDDIVNGDDDKPKVSDAKTKKELRDATRYVTSVEQMVPYLVEIGLDDDFDDDDDYNEDNVATNEICHNDYIHEEHVNYVDMMVLNPIVEPWDCLQKDVLNEDEIELSERHTRVFVSMLCMHRFLTHSPFFFYPFRIVRCA